MTRSITLQATRPAPHAVRRWLAGAALCLVAGFCAAECDPDDPQLIAATETASEQVSRLERELQGDMDRFEDCIKRDTSFDGGKSAGAAGAVAAGGTFGTEQRAADAVNEGAAAAEQAAEGGARTSAGLPGSHADVPDDIPAGSDDDIVAAQLREAAMAAASPQLSADLWNEYRKYKGLPEVAQAPEGTQ